MHYIQEGAHKKNNKRGLFKVMITLQLPSFQINSKTQNT